jgi:hypothetical protein
MDHPCAHDRYLVFRDAANLRSRLCKSVTWLLSRFMSDHVTPQITSDPHRVCSDTQIAQRAVQDGNQLRDDSMCDTVVKAELDNSSPDIEEGRNVRDLVCSNKAKCDHRKDSDIEQGCFCAHDKTQTNHHVDVHSNGTQTQTLQRNQPLHEVQHGSDEVSTCGPGAQGDDLCQACSRCKVGAEADCNSASDLGHVSEAEGGEIYDDFFSRQVPLMYALHVYMCNMCVCVSPDVYVLHVCVCVYIFLAACSCKHEKGTLFTCICMLARMHSYNSSVQWVGVHGGRSAAYEPTYMHTYMHTHTDTPKGENL